MLTISGVTIDFAGGTMFVTSTETVPSMAGPSDVVHNVTLPLPDSVAAIRADLEAALTAHFGVAPSAVTSAVKAVPVVEAAPAGEVVL